MIDLHLHTNMSDGSDSPLELLEKVKKAGLSVFSVTDHDDLRANAVILDALKEDLSGIKFLTGCEISSVFEGRNLHLLCYGFDVKAKSISQMIVDGATLRRQRITMMFDHLKNKHNIVILDEDKASILSRPIPGKIHVVDAIQKLGVRLSRQEIFDNCLEDMESRDLKIDAKRVIELVEQGGGKVSFAHPIEVQKEYSIDYNEIERMAKRLKDNGLCAIEVFHSKHGREDVDKYQEIALKCELLASGGSDYHGKNKEVRIGQLNSFGFVPPENKISICKCFL